MPQKRDPLKRMNKSIRNILTAGALLLLSGCIHDTAFHASHSLPGSKWDKRDTLSFQIDTLKLEQPLHLTTEVRTTKQYHYSSLSLIVEQRWGKGKTHRDTLVLDLKNKQDNKQTPIYLKSSDSPSIALKSQETNGEIRIWHFMKRENLPGITDVGVRITR